MLSDDDADVGILSPGWAGRPVAQVTGDAALVRAIVRFEAALATATAPHGVAQRITEAGHGMNPRTVAAKARESGNPVIPLLAALRSRLSEDDGSWLHRGATSQDALDTALVLLARDAVELIVADTHPAVNRFCQIAEAHRSTVMTGRTLGQPSTPVTLGVKVASWAAALAAAAGAARAAAHSLPVQVGGASGTLAAFDGRGLETVQRVAAELELPVGDAPWHVRRAPLTRLADALVEVCDAWGTVGTTMTALARQRLVGDGSSGRSSAMPQKDNPVRSVLLNAAALQAPLLGPQLHLAARSVDERPDGAWHAEWRPLRELLRTAGGAAATGRELADGFRADTVAIAAELDRYAEELVAEARKHGLSRTPTDYVGEADVLTSRLIASARISLA